MTTSPTPAADWIEWTGGENPVGDAVVEAEWRSGRLLTGEASDTAQFDWNHLGDHCDIIAYRVVSPTPASAANSEAVDEWPAERQVGVAVYERVDKLVLMNPAPDTSEWAELDYLSHLTESVEEVGGYDGPLKALQPHPSQQAGTEAWFKRLTEVREDLRSELAQVLDLLSCAETYHRADGEALDFMIVRHDLPNRAAKLIRELSARINGDSL